MPLGAPNNFVISVRTSTSLSMTWEAVPDAVSYGIFNNNNDLIQADITDLYWTHTGLDPMSSHTYKIATYDNIEYGSYSDPPITVSTRPAAVTNLQATADGTTDTIHLSWDNVSYSAY